MQTGWSVVNQSAEILQDVKPWYSLPELNLETWLKNKPIRLSSMMIRWQWLEEVGGFDSELRQSHDVDLVLRLSLKGCPFTWLRQVTTCYRQHPDNTTRNGIIQAQGLQAVLDKFFHRSDLPEPIRQMESQIRYTTLVWIAWHLYNTGYPAQMAQYLSKSLSYTSNFPAETISDWVASFARFAQERGDHFDADTFSDLREWQQLVIRC